MQSTMQDVPLTITNIFQRGRTIFGDSAVITCQGEASRTSTFAEVGERAARLAAALRDKLGIQDGDRVGTLCWNDQEHLEAYFAIPGIGAVLHTLNLRLPPQQLAFIVNHAQDRVVIVDSSLIPLLAAIRPHLNTVERVVVIGDGDVSALGGDVIRYDDLIADVAPLHEWPEIDERQAASMCYTTGTTGDPKGVVYSHRSIWLHSYAVWANFGFVEADRLLAIVPMFHVNAWGTPFACWMTGVDLLLPDRFLQPEPLLAFIQSAKPTFAAGVPTVFQGLLLAADAAGVRMDTIRSAICGGSAVPTALMQAYEGRHFPLVQAWGMTETSPIGAVANPPKTATADEFWHYRGATGRVVGGVELRITDDEGGVLPWDGEAVGEIEVRGPWITGSYYGVEAPERFHDGWLRTGDVGSVDRQGFIQITDRAKDVIKSGGEWISSVEIENLLMGHPGVADAACVGVPDEKWQERPLAVVVAKPGATVSPEELRSFLQDRVARFWLPERWAIIEEIPKTSVGKQDKKRIRSLHAENAIAVVTLGSAGR
ncbi:MAG: long-chain fatty acid--CoA ligase [Candidatus Dormibacteria bacterium]